MKRLLLLAGGLAGIAWALRPSKLRSLPYALLIKDAGRKYRIDPLLIASIIKIESDFNTDAIGDGGTSYGLMQVNCTATLTGRLSTARVMGYRGACLDLLIPSIGIDVGTAYLAKQIKRYQEQGYYDIEIPVVAYNTGSAFTADGRLKTGTNNYAKRVMAYYRTL
jgi:membrane-bound lytic murein transglycosylase E